MGLFSKILPVLEGVAGVVLMATGVGVVAGAMLLTSALATSGVIGGSVGKFLNSGWGQGLMAAVSLGSTAYAMYGADALSTSATAMQDTAMNSLPAADQSAAQAAVQSNLASAANTTADVGAGTQGTDLLKTGVDISGPVGYNTATAVTPGSAAANGVPQTNLLNPNSTISASGSVPAQSQALENTQQMVASNPQAQSNAAFAGQNANAPGGVPSAASTQGANAADLQEQPTPSPTDYKSAPFDNSAAYAAPGNTTGGGLMNTLLNTKGGAAAITAGGNMLGGLGQGIVQKQSMQDQINAMQWADRTSSDPQLKAQALAASAQPITVPQGYLQRAQALRAMINTPQGPQPGGVAGAPAAPSGGPVPVYGMNATPRGGMTGG